MLYRRYDFTGDELSELIEQFVPVVVEHRSWQDSLPDRETFFRGFLQRSGMFDYEPAAGHGANLLVGLFGLRPDGTLLMKGRTNTEGPASKTETADYLRQMLVLWGDVAKKDRGFKDLAPDFPRPANLWHNAAHVPPMSDQALILQSFTRDLPREREERTAEGLERRKPYFSDIYNSDFMMVSDPGALVPKAPVVGAVYGWPTWLETRLARFHLVDNVAGLTISYPKKAIEKAEVFVKVLAVEAEAVELEIFGSTRAVARGDWGFSQTRLDKVSERGMETEIRGRAVWLPVEKRFGEFRMTAVGTRWGGTPQNRRAEVEFPPFTDDLDGGPIGVHFRLYEGPKEEIVAPFFAWYKRGDPLDYWGREVQ